MSMRVRWLECLALTCGSQHDVCPLQSTTKHLCTSVDLHKYTYADMGAVVGTCTWELSVSSIGALVAGVFNSVCRKERNRRNEGLGE